MSDKTSVITESNEKYIKAVHEKFSSASEKSFKIIEDFISGGFYDSFARLIVYLPEERRKEALSKLPEGIREKVEEKLPELSEKTNLDAEILSTVGSVLKNADFAGKNAADEVISQNDPLYNYILKDEYDSLYAENPLLAINVEKFLFSIDIILMLDDRAVQKFLREVETDVIAKALKGAAGEIQDKIYRNMSRRAAAMLREDMEFMGPVRLSDVLEAQQQCTEIIKRLEENGEIVISGLDCTDGDLIF